VELLLVDRDAAGLATFAETLVSQGVRAETCVADLSDSHAATQIIEQAHKKLGGLNALLSNAGAIHMTKLQDMSLEEYERIFSINARATFLLAKAAYPLLKESQGAIVATASMASQHPAPSLGAYSASKAAAAMLVQQMALEWGPDGIRANSISPGPTMTAMTSKSYSDTAKRDQRASEIPLRRIGLPEDLANAALFLASPFSSFITGVNLVVDGGLSLTTMVSAASAATNMDNR
jgi:NAD(P)-dependent dehydrogenase (short-subunit alcohol dehydrogenase family)